MLSLGIDIGSFSVKAAKVRSTPKGYEILSLTEYPLPQDPNKDPQIDIIEALRDIYKRYWEDSLQIVVGVHQYDVSLRRKEFPFRERHKILKSLPFELEDDIPLSIENSVFDAKVTHYAGNIAHVLAIACPKSHIEEALKKFSDGGIQPHIVSVDSVASANVFEEWREAPWEYPEKPQLETPAEVSIVDVVVNVGHKTTTVSLIKDGYLLDVRMIDWGGKDIAETIASRYSMHYLEALKELRKKAFILISNEGATKDQIALSEVIKSVVDPFAQNLQLTLLELKSHYNVDFRQMALTGGVSQIRNLGAYLTQKTEIAANRLAKLDQAPTIDFASSPNNEIASVTAIGLALEGIKRPKNPAINLLKGEFAAENKTLKIVWEQWGPTLQALAIAFVLFFVWTALRDSFSFSNAETAYSLLRSQAAEIIKEKKRPSQNDIKTYIRDQDNKLILKEAIDSLQSINSALDILSSVSKVAPTGLANGLNVHEFNVANETLIIRGEASQEQTIKKLEAALKSIAREGTLKPLPPTPARLSGYKSFNYQLKVARRGSN